jgi:uncharacterized protein (TIGR04255 family)
MASWPHLSKAPIREALIDFRVPNLGQKARAGLEGLANRQADRYPLKNERQFAEGRLGVKDGATVAATGALGFHGFFVKSRDGLTVVQFRIDGMTVNRLRPYTSWESLLPEVLRLWTEYAVESRPAEIIRLAVRYINELELGTSEDLSAYLIAAPRIPPKLPQVLQSYRTRFVLLDEQRSAQCTITQVLQPGLDPSKVSLVLDIDAARRGPLPVVGANIAEELEVLRDLKNQAFFGSITDRAKELLS